LEIATIFPRTVSELMIATTYQCHTFKDGMVINSRITTEHPNGVVETDTKRVLHPNPESVTGYVVALDHALDLVTVDRRNIIHVEDQQFCADINRVRMPKGSSLHVRRVRERLRKLEKTGYEVEISVLYPSAHSLVSLPARNNGGGHMTHHPLFTEKHTLLYGDPHKLRTVLPIDELIATSSPKQPLRDWDKVRIVCLEKTGSLWNAFVDGEVVLESPNLMKTYFRVMKEILSSDESTDIHIYLVMSRNMVINEHKGWLKQTIKAGGHYLKVAETLTHLIKCGRVKHTYGSSGYR